MDRQLRRQGLLSNTAALFTSSRAEVLATLPLHVNAGLRRVIHGFGYVADELLHRGWREVEIEQPLFIVAPARSGTTMLFHLLAADPQFAATTLGNTLIRSISVAKLLRRAADKQRGLILAARDGINKQMSALDDTHTLRIELLEEDEGFYNDMFALMNVHLLFPNLYKKLGIVELDQRPSRVRRAVMRRYKNFIRRFLYLRRNLHGGGQTYLMKNVQSPGRMETLEQAFPDARYIHIVRDPVVQLPSALELIRAVAKSSHGRVRPPEHPYWRLVADSLIEQHRKLLAWERRLPASRWLTLRYPELIADPAATLRRIYEHFQLPLSPEREQSLRTARQRAEEFRKQRSYALADYGISPQEVRERLAEVYDFYQLER
jgi:hypothetical protein